MTNLPASYHEGEVRTAIANLRAGFVPKDTLHTTRVLVEATQAIRAERRDWGACTRRAPVRKAA